MRKVKTTSRTKLGLGCVATITLEAEVLDGIDEERRVFFGGLRVDAVSKVHDMVAAAAIAKDLLRALLREKLA